MYIRGSIIGTILAAVLVVLVFLFATPVKAALTYPVDLTSVNGIGASVGQVGFTESE